MKKSVRFLFLFLLISCMVLSLSAFAEDPECSHEQIEQIPGRPAACTADGYKEYFRCPMCNSFFEDPAAQKPIEVQIEKWIAGEGKIPAGHILGDWETGTDGKHIRNCVNCDYAETHDPDWDEGGVITEPTCEAPGILKHGCASCPQVFTESIDKLGHDFGNWEKKDDETHRRVCKNDNAHTEEESHDWDEGVESRPPTCEEDGERLFTCSVCLGTKTEIIPHGHNWGEWEKTETEHRRVCKTDPSHEEKGSHSWDGGVITKDADCGVEGVMTYTCQICSKTKTEPVAALEHQYSDWEKVDNQIHMRVCARNPDHVESENHNWDSGIVTKEPTIASKGLKVYHCDLCAGTKEEILDRLPLDTKTEASALKTVPEELKAKPELDSPEKITAALKAALKKKSSSDKTAVYDIKLMYSTDHGKTWQEGGKEFFPAGGKLLVTIPYPRGTNSVGYSFVAVHMFGSSDFGKTPGDVEYPAVKNTANGIQMELTGLSPVAVSWTSNGVSTGDDNNAPLWVMLLLLSSGAFCAAVVCEKKRRTKANN